MASRDDLSPNPSPAGGPGSEAPTTGPVPPHPPQPKGIWAKIGLGFGAATLVAIAAPRITTEGSTPPMSALLVSGLFIALVTSAALYLGIRSDMRLSARVALYAVGYNVLLVAVKFVFAPRGLYEVNQEVTLEQSLFSQTTPPERCSLRASCFCSTSEPITSSIASTGTGSRLCAASASRPSEGKVDASDPADSRRRFPLNGERRNPGGVYRRGKRD
jgi:hypothetical protein